MKSNRINLDLYFTKYKYKSRVRFFIPLLFAVLFGLAGLTLHLDFFNLAIHALYAYGLYGLGGILLTVSILGFILGKDRTTIPTDIQLVSFLAEDIARVKATLKQELSPDFRVTQKKDIVVVNHCHKAIDGFRPYFKKSRDGTLFCSLNKITCFTFGAKRLQIFTAIVDMFTGIEIKQHSLKIPYDNILDCYIAYSTYLRPESLRFVPTQKNGGLSSTLSEAIKTCREVLRIKVKNRDDLDENNGIIISHDIVVADYEIYHKNGNSYKIIYSINNGSQLESEILTRCGKSYITQDENFAEDKTTNYNFIDDIGENISNSFSSKATWN